MSSPKAFGSCTGFSGVYQWVQSGRCGEGVSYCLGGRRRNKQKEAAKNKVVVVNERERGRERGGGTRSKKGTTGRKLTRKCWREGGPRRGHRREKGRGGGADRERWIRRDEERGKGEETLGCSGMHYNDKTSNRRLSGNARSSFRWR